MTEGRTHDETATSRGAEAGFPYVDSERSCERADCVLSHDGTAADGTELELGGVG